MMKFALVGCGDAGRQHMSALPGLGKLVAVCDTNVHNATAAADLNAANFFSSFDEMLVGSTDADVVVVCTPNGYHAEHVIKSLQAGKHVLCESPLCLTASAAWQIAETEKFCGKKVFVVDRFANAPAVQEAKTRIRNRASADKAFWQYSLRSHSKKWGGKPWASETFPGGGPLYTPFAEYVGVLRSLFGPVAKAERMTRQDRAGKQTEDASTAMVRFEDGAACQLIWTVNGEGPEQGILGFTTTPYSNGSGVDDLQTVAVFQTGQGNNLRNLYQNFFASLNTAGPSTLLPAVQTVETIEAVYKALRRS